MLCDIPIPNLVNTLVNILGSGNVILPATGFELNPTKGSCMKAPTGCGSCWGVARDDVLGVRFWATGGCLVAVRACWCFWGAAAAGGRNHPVQALSSFVFICALWNSKTKYLSN